MSQESNHAVEDTGKRKGDAVREGYIGGADVRRRRQQDWRVRAFKGSKGGIVQYLVPSTDANSEIAESLASPTAASNDDLDSDARQGASTAPVVVQAPASPKRPTILNLLLAGKAQTPPPETKSMTPQRTKSIPATSPSSFPGPTQMWARTPSISPQPRRRSSELQSDKENLRSAVNYHSVAEVARTLEHPRAPACSRSRISSCSSFARVQAPPSPVVPRCMWGRRGSRSRSRRRSRSRSCSHSPVPGPTQMWGCLTQSVASPGAALQAEPARPPPCPILEKMYAISPTMPFDAAVPDAGAAAGAASQPTPWRPPLGPSLEQRYSISPTMPFHADAPDVSADAGAVSQPTPTRPPLGPSLELRYSISPTVPFHASAPDANMGAASQ